MSAGGATTGFAATPRGAEQADGVAAEAARQRSRGVGSTRDQFRWAVYVRWLVIAGFLVLGILAWLCGVIVDPWPCAMAALGASLLNAFNQAALRRWRWIGVATLAAVIGDIVLLTYLVVATGGTRSPFAAMYFVQVLAAAMLVEARVAALCALAAVGALVVVVLLQSSGAAGAVDVANASYVPVWGLFVLYGLGLIAYIGGYVSVQLRQRELALEASNRDLTAALSSLATAHRRQSETYERLDKTERQLAQSEKMRSLGDFVAGVAHELNNPIAIVTANLEVLTMRLADIDRAERPVDEIVSDCTEAAARAARIVADLRQFSRVAESRVWGPVDVNERARRSVDLARHLFGASVALELGLAQVPMVHAVATEIDQVLMNLLSNAAHAVGDSGRISIRTAFAEGGLDGSPAVLLRVEDDGPGVAPDIRRRLFEPFFTTRPEGEGVGLGLSLSFAIVERHGGRLRIDEAVPSGACFEAAFPLPAGTVLPAGREMDA